MLRRVGYYLSFLLLIFVFGFSGLSNIVDTKTVYILCGLLIFISLSLGIYKTLQIKKREKQK